MNFINEADQSIEKHKLISTIDNLSLIQKNGF